MADTAGTKVTLMDAWALSLGCILGWGVFVMPGTTFLPLAGPAGTAVAMGLGALLMLSIAANFAFMMGRHPDRGGAFSYVRRTFGYDHAFLCAWALGLAYVALIWANATAFTLFARYLLGPLFLWGFHYTVFSYDVYLGEILAALAILLGFGVFCARCGDLVPKLQTALVWVFLAALAVCCAVAFARAGGGVGAFAPAFAGGRPEAAQVLGVAALAPWAFVGFESIAHSADDLRFPAAGGFPVMLAAIAVGALAYVALTCLATLSVPDSYASWREYAAGLGDLRGVIALPTFHAAKAAMGGTGLTLLGVAAVAALSTSMLGFFRAASRLVCAMAGERLLPACLARQDRAGAPRNATYAVMCVSLGMPFLGRTVIGWLTDITTITASIAYLYTSLCSWVWARRCGRAGLMATGMLGAAVSAVALIFPLVATLWDINTLAKESYFVLAAWSVIGFIAYNVITYLDTRGIVGKSTAIFIIMCLFLVLSTGMLAKKIIYDAIMIIRNGFSI